MTKKNMVLGKRTKSKKKDSSLKEWIVKGAVSGAVKSLVNKLLESCPSIDKLLDSLPSINDIDFDF